MTRPAVIIGLGGTGQWVLTYLKKNLLEAGEGTLPNNVRFLAFDTMPQPEVEVRTVGGEKEERAEVGTVRLTKEEFVHIGGDANDLGERIAQDEPEYAHISKWFQAKKWRNILRQQDWLLDEGAGRIRQMGRLAVFKDLLNGSAGSKVWLALRTSIESVKSTVNDQNRLAIIIVGSFAGGTGSGSLIDISLLARHMAKGINHDMQAYIVLPTAFTSNPSNEMLARGFAAWRELDRFMVTNTNFPLRVDYLSNNTDFRVTRDQRLFDSCFLVDSYRMGSPRTVEPKHGVFPTIAEAISAMLDDKVGDAYTKWVSVNMAKEYENNQGAALYGAIGTYTLKVPAYYKQQIATHQFAMSVIETLLRPGNIEASGANRVAMLALPDQNLERGRGRAGRKEVREFLSTQEVRYGEETARPTLFTHKIAEIMEAKGPANDTLIEDYAAHVLRPIRDAHSDEVSWLGPFTNLGEDPTFEAVRQEVTDEVSISVIKLFGPRERESRAQSIKRLEGFKEFIFRHYGGESTTEENEGLFGEALEKARNFQVDLFKRLVRIWTLRTLMGESTTDLEKARSGKLGYAYDFFDGLVEELEQIRLFLDAVQDKREQGIPRLQLEGRAETARKIAEASSTEKIFWIIPTPRFGPDLDKALKSQQRLVDLRKEELLHKHVLSTIQAMKGIAIEARGTMERWIWHLGTGDEPTGVPGLYSQLVSRVNTIDLNHRVDRDISEDDKQADQPSIQRLISEAPPAVEAPEVNRVLSTLTWQASMIGGKLKLAAQFEPERSGEGPLQLENPDADNSIKQLSALGESNTNALIRISSRRYERLVAGTRIGPLLMREFATPQQLETHIGRKAEPLTSVKHEDAPKKTAFIRAPFMNDEAAVRDYFMGLEAQMRSTAHTAVTPQSGDAGTTKQSNQNDNYMITAIDSEDPYKVTILRTEEGYRRARFTAWEKCADGYFKYICVDSRERDPMLLHNFTAEAYAADLERTLAYGEARRVLHPWIVMLLEEPERFQQAVYCLLIGYIKPSRSGESYVWKLELPTSRGTQSFTLSEKGTMEGTLIQALYTFCMVGKDIRKGYERMRFFPIRPNEPNLVDFAIAQKRQQWGKAEAEVWQDVLDPANLETIQSWLRSMAEIENESGSIEEHPELRDLADLMDMILMRRVKMLTPGWKPVEAEIAAPEEEVGPYKYAGLRPGKATGDGNRSDGAMFRDKSNGRKAPNMEADIDIDTDIDTGTGIDTGIDTDTDTDTDTGDRKEEKSPWGTF